MVMVKQARKGRKYVYMKNKLKSAALSMLIGLSSLAGSAAPVFADEVTSTAQQDIYRLYNKATGEHFYTASSGEKDHLVAGGWKYEGIGWRALTQGDPVYRLYNPNNGGDHYYTVNHDEASKLVQLGWLWDNAANPVFYSGGNYDLYVEYNPNAKSGAHNYTTSANEHLTLLDRGWTHGAVAWKVAGEGEPVVNPAPEPALPPVTSNPQPAPSQPAVSMNYVANTRSGKFHRAGCSSVRKMSAGNRWDVYATRDYLTGLGYEPCKICRP